MVNLDGFQTPMSLAISRLYARGVPHWTRLQPTSCQKIAAVILHVVDGLAQGLLLRDPSVRRPRQRHPAPPRAKRRLGVELQHK